MKRNRQDLVMDKIIGHVEKVTDHYTKEFKDTNPFDQEPVKVEDQLYDYLTLDMNRAGALIQEFGMDAFKSYQDEMEKELSKRRK